MNSGSHGILSFTIPRLGAAEPLGIPNEDIFQLLGYRLLITFPHYFPYWECCYHITSVPNRNSHASNNNKPQPGLCMKLLVPQVVIFSKPPSPGRYCVRSLYFTVAVSLWCGWLSPPNWRPGWYKDQPQPPPSSHVQGGGEHSSACRPCRYHTVSGYIYDK